MSDSRDSSRDTAMSSPTHVNFDVEVGKSPTSSNAPRYKAPSIRSEPDISDTIAPILKRRQTRANTSISRTVTSFDAASSRPSWHPGQEPGLDPNKANGGRSTIPTLHEECQITVVDFSEEEMVMHDFNNTQLIEFLDKKQEGWLPCRWINVPGLRWDVIQALGKCKKLHRLSIEDMLNTNNRTKVDWSV